jgi:heme-degrading monooxygenase HmoA
MIARIWHGYTTSAHANEYETTLRGDILPGISEARGYIGSYLLRRPNGEEVEFVTILLWKSLDALREFAGPDYERAIVPAERRKFLSRYDENSAHYEVVVQPACEQA